MHQLILERPGRIRKFIARIKKKIDIKISVKDDRVDISGDELNGFLVVKILRAVDFGFDIEDALLLLNEDFHLEFINIKDFTRRRNLEDVRGRVIGARGKAKKTIEDLTGGHIVIHNNRVGIIVNTEHLESIVQAIQNLIHGAKHSNVFAYLEKQNVILRDFDEEDLGLRGNK